MRHLSALRRPISLLTSLQTPWRNTTARQRVATWAAIVAIGALGVASPLCRAQTPTDALPAEVLALLARAGVPRTAISVLVQALPPPVAAASPDAKPGTGAGAVSASNNGAAVVSVSSTGAAAVPAPSPAAGSAPAPRLALRPELPVNPASVMKLVTTYAALDTYGADFVWKNRVYVDGFVGQNGQPGVLDGNLVLRGGGDPKLVVERIADLFAQVQAKGVREVRGDIILDRSVFNVPDKNPADFDDEPLRPYNAVPDGLLVNFKSLIFTFTPDLEAKKVRVSYEPPISGVEIPGELPLSGGPCGDHRSLLQANFYQPGKISFAGRYAASCGQRVWPVAYSEPRAYAARVIEAMWRASGGLLTGRVREDATPRTARLLLTADSLPLSSIIADVNKFSNNVMAQQVFLTLSAYPALRMPASPTDSSALSLGNAASLFPTKRGSFEASQRALAAWWAQTLPQTAAPTLENGSGLSRKERISAQALTALLQHAAQHRQAQVFADSLGLAGIDGTVAKMRERNAAPAALGNAQLKTGTLKDVAAVAGYATGRSGQRYSVVGIINHPNASAADARMALDKLVEWTVKDQ